MQTLEAAKERIAQLEALLGRALDMTEHSGGDPDCPGCRLVRDIRLALGMIENIEDAGEEEKEAVRRALRSGRVQFSEVARASIDKKGLTEDQVIAMLMDRLGMKLQ